MQQVGTIAAYVAEKIFSLFPKFDMMRYFPSLTVRRRQRVRNVGVFLLLFVFPSLIVVTGYHYVRGQGGFWHALSEFGQLELQQVNLTVYQADKLAHRTDWHVDPEAIKAALPIKLGTSMFDINPDSIRRVINDVPWVKSASVKLILPSTLSVTLQEQRPFALWQRDEMFYLIT